MPRPSRTFVPDHPYHLIQRGNNRQVVFVNDEDRRRYLSVLAEVARDEGVQLHAYVLMSNHVHLLATPRNEAGLSRLMQSLGRRYVGAFNARHGRTGTLWEGRFKAHLVDADAYLLSCLRYIELNPHRAGLVSDLLDYPWSSLAHHLGKRVDPCVVDHPVFWQLGNTPFEREAAYRAWLEEGVSMAEQKRFADALKTAAPMASPELIERLRRDKSLPPPPKPRGRPRKAE